MKFLLDETADARLVLHLDGRGHDVTRIGTDYPSGISDLQVLSIARAEARILICSDRDFGEFAFRHRERDTGVILFRLGDYAPLEIKMDRVDEILDHYFDKLDQFLSVGDNQVRVRTGELKPPMPD